MNFLKDERQSVLSYLFFVCLEEGGGNQKKKYICAYPEKGPRNKAVTRLAGGPVREIVRCAGSVGRFELVGRKKQVIYERFFFFDSRIIEKKFDGPNYFLKRIVRFSDRKRTTALTCSNI